MAGEESLSFEQAITELEDIVQKMENGDLSLEESVDCFKRGTFLARLCRGKLDAAEAAVKEFAGETGTPAQSRQGAEDGPDIPF